MTAAILRPYQDGDREAVLELFGELNRHEYAISGDRRTDLGGAQSCVDEMVRDLAKGTVATVAERDGVVIGLMVWSERADDAYMIESVQRFGFIQDIVVAEAHRGKGVAKALLAEAERLTRDAGMTRLRLAVLTGNDGAIETYRRSGFRDYAQAMIKDLA